VLDFICLSLQVGFEAPQDVFVKVVVSLEFWLPLHIHSSHEINSYAKVDKFIEGQQCIPICDISTAHTNGFLGNRKSYIGWG
jgi:hypothetical protein